MTPNQLHNCLDQLGWSTMHIAEQAAVSPVTARRWLNGKVPIPPDMARIIEQMAALAATLSRKPG